MSNRILLTSVMIIALTILSQFTTRAQIPVFPLNSEGYQCFRIPSILTIGKEELLAFAEGRKNSCSDFGNVDLVMKRSVDGGNTWNPLRVIVDNDSLQAGNIAPVFDRFDPEYPGGRIFVFYNTGNAFEWQVRSGKGLREVWYITSTDKGKTWSRPVNITLQVHRPNQPDENTAYNFTEDWRAYANTPGHGLQMNSGKYKGRIFIPVNHTEGEPKEDWTDCFAGGFYTDDHGRSFHLAENISIAGSNECTAAETSNGGVMINARNQKGIPRERIAALSSNGGESWDSTWYEDQIIDPVCQASLMNVRLKEMHILLFTNPASTSQRVNLTLRASYDDGMTWPDSILLIPGDAAYNDISVYNKTMLGVLYEKGSDGGIYFMGIDLKSTLSFEKVNGKRME